MICPHAYDDLSGIEWSAIHDQLKRALASEIEEAAPFGALMKGAAWWVDVSYAECLACDSPLLRCRIKGHPRSPFYACLQCGLILEWRDLTSDAAPGKPS